MNINMNDIYNWTYGLYFSGLSKIRNDSIVSLKNITNNRVLFNLYDSTKPIDGLIDRPNSRHGGLAGPDINGVFDNDDVLEQSRQFIKIPLSSPINIVTIKVNSSIYPNLLFNGTSIDYITNQAYSGPIVRFETLHSTETVPVTHFSYNAEQSTIEYTFDTALDNVISIVFLGARPQKQSVINSSIEAKNSSSFIINAPDIAKRNNLVFTDIIDSIPGYTNLIVPRLPLINNNNAEGLISLSYNTTELIPLAGPPGSYGAIYNRLELQTINSQYTAPDELKAVTINKQFYFMPLEQAINFSNSSIIPHPENQSLEIYKSTTTTSSGGLKSRIVFPYVRPWEAYQRILSDQWFDELLQLIYTRDSSAVKTFQYFNVDDFEFVDVYIADGVTLTSLSIEANDLAATPTPTPTPSNTVSPTPTPTPTLTPTPTEPFRIRGKVVSLTNNGNNGIVPIEQDPYYAGVPLYFDRVFVGANHALVSREDKTIFPLLDNSSYQLGVQSPFENIDKLNTIIGSIDSRWNKIAVSNKFSYLINTSSHLYRWGDNSRGQLASPLNVLQTPTKLSLEHTDMFLDVSVADDHTFIIDINKNLYFTGSIFSSLQANTFTAYPSNQGDWLRVFTSNEYTYGIKTDNKLYLLRNKNKINSFFNNPIIIDNNILNFIDIACGKSHLLLIKQDGSLWGFGNNDFYQLGSNQLVSAQNTLNKLVPIDTERAWLKVAAGSKHSLAIDENSSLYGWGDNSLEQLGIKNLPTIMTPTLIWSGNWIDIDTYDNITFGVVDSTDVTTSLITPTPTASQTPSPTHTPTPSNTNTPTPSTTIFPTPTSTITSTLTTTKTPAVTSTPTPTKPYNFSVSFVIP